MQDLGVTVSNHHNCGGEADFKEHLNWAKVTSRSETGNIPRPQPSGDQ